MRRGDRRLGRRRRCRRGDARRGGPRRRSCSRRAHSYDRDSYPENPLDAIASLYRDGGLTIAEGRPPIPVPVAQDGRRHDGDQLGHVLPRSRAGARRAGESATGSTWADRLAPDFAEAEEFLRVTPVDPERMGRNGQLAMEGAAAIGASGGPISRNAGNCVQCSSCPYGCRDRREAGHARQLPAARRRRRGASSRRGRSAADPGRGWPRRRGRCRLAGLGNGDGGYAVRARRATIVAGGALGTPELLLRSGLGGAEVGRNLHIHPACWVGARYEEEVRGWDGVMQSYYVDEWETRARPARGDLHAAALRRRLAARLRAASTRRRSSASDTSARSASTSPTSRRERVGLARDGSMRATYELTRRGRRPTRLRHRPRRGNPLRGGRHARSTPTSAASRCCAPADLAEFEATRFRPSELRLEAFHPMGTARIAADPGEGVCAARRIGQRRRGPLRRRRLALPHRRSASTR